MEERLFKKIDGCFKMIEVIKKEEIPLSSKLSKIEAQMSFIFGYIERLKELEI